MTIFAVLLPTPQPGLVAAIEREFKEVNRRKVSETQWLLASTKTVIEVTAKLGIYDANNPSVPPTGNAIVLAVAAYFGRAPIETWDWIRSRLESTPDD